MRLTGQYVESFERGDDPERFDAAIAQLRAADIWQHVRPSMLKPGPGVQVRVSRALDWYGPYTPGVVAASRHASAPGGKLVRRSLVVMPAYQGSDESREVSLLEIASAFERGVESIEYLTTPDATAAIRRIKRLGGAEVRMLSTAQLVVWCLTRDAFMRAMKSAGKGAHVFWEEQ